MRIATGSIRASDLVPNRERRFGQATHFNQAALEQAGKEPVALLFSNDQIQVARERAEANPEDLLQWEPEQVRIDRAVAIARKDERAQVVASMQAERKGVMRRALWVGFVTGVGAALMGSGLGALL